MIFLKCVLLVSSLWLSPSHGAPSNERNVFLRGGDRRPLQEPCLAVLLKTENSPGSAHGNDVSLACETNEGMFYRVPANQDWILEKMNRGILKSGISRLKFPQGAMIDESLAAIDFQGADPIIDEQEDSNRRQLFEKTGTKTVLAVIIKTMDDAVNSVTFDEAVLWGEVFGNNVNLKTQMDACSHGKISFTETNDMSSGSISIKNGVATVTVTKMATDGDQVLVNAATNMLNSAFGVTRPDQIADHVMFCLPAISMPGIAYAAVNSWLSAYENTWCLSPSAQMHEIGHNIGLDHSGETGTYDDKTGMMGYSYSPLESPKMCYNAAKSWQLGWYTEKQETYIPQCAPVEVTVGSVIDFPRPEVDRVLLQLLQPTNGVDHYYMTYNAAASFNVETKEAGNRLIINKQGGNGVSFSPSLLVAKLDANGSFVINDYDGIAGDSLIVTFKNRVGYLGREALVEIVWIPLDSSKCPAPTASPIPSASPTESPSSPPTKTTTPTLSPTASPTPKPSPSPTARPTAKPTQCARRNEVCYVDSDCCDFRAKCQLQDRKNRDSPLVCSK